MKTSRPTLHAIFFLLGAAALRFWALDQQSLWNDEMFSIQVASFPLSEIPSRLAEFYNHPPLYFLLLHFMMKWVGVGEWSLRFLSALFGSLTVGAMFLITRKMIDKQTAIWASLFCLIAPFHIAYSQEARAYAMTGFLCLLGLFALHQAWKTKRVSSYILYCLITVAALYTHHWVIFLIVAQVTFIIFEALLHRESLKLPLLSFLAIAVLYLPMLGTVVHQTEKVAASPWWWTESASMNHLLWTELAFSGVYFKLASGVFESPVAVKLLGAIATVPLLVLAVWAGRRKEAWAIRAVLFSILATAALAFAASVVHPETYLWYRYPVILFPFFCIALAVGLNHIKMYPLRLAFAGVFLLLAGVGTFRYFHWEKANAKSVAAFVETIASEKTDVVIRPAYFADLFNYYYRGRAQQVNEGAFDDTIAPAIQNVNQFVLITLDIPNEVRDYINTHFEKVMERKFPGEAHTGIVVGVYRRMISPELSAQFNSPIMLAYGRIGGET